MDIAIVGAANSAVDAALETFRKGAKSVTMIIREKKIRENVKYWSKPDIENRIKEGAIKALFNSEIVEIQEKYLIIKNRNEKIRIKNDFVLAMTGYQPNFKLLKSVGIKFNKDKDFSPRYNKDTMESNVKGVYLAGVICGGYQTNKWFIENSRIHASQIIKHIKEKMNILIAPDSFKECLPASKVANSIANGINKINPNHNIEKIPISDGGEGSIEFLKKNCDGEAVEHKTENAIGNQIISKYFKFKNSKTAWVELSQASGLSLIGKKNRNPGLTSTYGTGLSINHAIKNGCSEIILSLGGSATNDAGAGFFKH